MPEPRGETRDYTRPSMDDSGHDWAEAAEQALSEAGYRRGEARRALLELLDEQACALSAIEIEDLLRTRRRARSSQANACSRPRGAARSAWPCTGSDRNSASSNLQSAILSFSKQEKACQSR